MSADAIPLFKVYVDGIFDLFHSGHVNFLEQAINEAKKLAGDRTVSLIVGVCKKGVTQYKRKTIMSADERGEAVKANRLVHQMIIDCPLVIDKRFLMEHQIDLVIHGNDFTEEKRNLYYSAAISENKYREVPYTQGVSTTQLIREAKNEGRFSTSLTTTLLDEQELIQRIQKRSWEELKVS